MNSRLKELLSNTLLFTIANLGSKVLVFFMVPLYTAILSPEDYGISDLISTTVALLYPLLTLSIVDAVLRFCFVKGEDVKQVFSTGAVLIGTGGLLCFLLYFLLRDNPVFMIVKDYVIFVPIIFCTTSFSRLMISFSRGIDHVKESAYNGVIHTCSIIALNLLFLLVFEWGILGYLLSIVISDVVSIVYLSVKCDVLSYCTCSLSKQLGMTMCKYSIPLIPNSLSWWLLSSLNRYFITFFLGVGAVGLFSAAMRIPTILTVLSNIFAEAWLLSAIKDYGTEESKAFIKSVHVKFFVLLLLVTAGLIVLSHPLAMLLLSGEYENEWKLIPYLFISVFLGALSGFIGALYSAEKRTNLHFYSTLLGSIVSIFITYCFVERYGLPVISVSMLVGYFLIWLFRRLTIIKYINIGLNIWYSIFLCLVLIGEAYCVIREFYLGALGLILVLLFLNYKEVIKIWRFTLNTLRHKNLNFR